MSSHNATVCTKAGLAAVALIVLLGQTGCGEADPAAEAWAVCAMFVQNRAGIPSDDAGPYDPSGVTELASNHHIVRVDYAKAGGSYRCEVIHRPDGNWQLLRLEFVR